MMQYTLMRFFASLLYRLPWRALRVMASFMGGVFWYAATVRRTEAIQAVEKHLKVPHEEAARIARQSFTENFLSFLEIFHAGKSFTDQSALIVHTPESKAAILAETAPIVIATAHIGSWEKMPGLAADALSGRKCMVVVRRQKNRNLNRLMAELRGARGMLIVDHRKASDIVLPGLRAGSVAAFLVDHNTSRKEAVFLPFFEDIAAVNVGPASLALRTKAAVYPVFVIRDGKGGHILHIFPPLHTATLKGSIKERVQAIAVFYTDAVAEMVRRYPEQWLWMHRRWKTREKKE